MIKLYIAWPEIPMYAADAIQDLVKSNIANVEVLATTANLPILNIEETLGKKVFWIEKSSSPSLSDIGLSTPDILLVGGYKVEEFKLITSQCIKQHCDVYMMSDNPWIGSLKNKLIDKAIFYLYNLNKYKGFFVPGESSVRLYKENGVSRKRIYKYLYTSNPEKFYSDKPLHKREKNFIFIGQLIHRKNILRLCGDFIEFQKQFSDWKLKIYGNGDLKTHIPPHNAIEVSNFQQSNDIAKFLRNSRCLILPSLSENWGLVVNEAAMSGCALILSSCVGARFDLASNANSLIFDTHDKKSLVKSMIKFAEYTDIQLNSANKESIRLSSDFTPKNFTKSVEQMIYDSK